MSVLALRRSSPGAFPGTYDLAFIKFNAAFTRFLTWHTLDLAYAAAPSWHPSRHNNKQMSDSPMQSPTNALFRPRSTSSLSKFESDGRPARDRAPAPVKPPPLDTTVSQGRKWTQQDQDEDDAEARKKAMKELVQSWMDRLQLISLITTFFAATESQLLGITVPDDSSSVNAVVQAANAGLAGALVIHVFAAILSFFAAFFLIRYRLREAKREEHKVEEATKSDTTVHQDNHIFSSNPHLEPFGPFRRGLPPTHLLENCHTLCMWLSAVGFVLALVGVLCFAWARMPRSVSIFASTCMWLCLVCGAFAVAEARWRTPNPTRS
ncbi:hypothetical protein EIP91_000986 [Steccherinum ochraceum]|uniref:Transmembrane protein n=1 Tax=Steccherinum ochraceum TaxID=92696 RepID=A0A4R0RLA0_9APHY|nr:hypothetical protein EIP91_000986 [Steccherinum ochraceum]